MTAWDWTDAEVVRVIDGDTFVGKVTRDLGFNGTASFTQRLRLNRINAKPVKTMAGRAATETVQRLTAGCKLQITTTGPYKYGDEWMAEVTLPGGENLSDELVRLELAIYWSGKGPRPD